MVSSLLSNSVVRASRSGTLSLNGFVTALSMVNSSARRLPAAVGNSTTPS